MNLLRLKTTTARVLYALWIELMTILRRRVLGAKAVVINDRNGKVLLVRHSYKGRSRWYLPGGAVEYGEAPVGTIKRELAEELKLITKDVTLVGIYTGRKNSLTFLFVCEASYEVNSFTNKQLEIEEVSFFSIKRLPEDIAPGVKRRIEDATAFLTQNNKEIIWGRW